MKKPILHYKSIILSDVHLGISACKIDEVNYFLKHTSCDKLILNGDIIDGWQLMRKGGWTKEHTRFVRLVLKKLEKENTQVVYLRGNHDDILSRFLPLTFEGIDIVEEYVHTAGGKNYLILHGDVFDAITTRMVFLARLGAIGYEWLLRLNRLYNWFRALRGKEYYSVSKLIKARVKTAVSYISKFESEIANLATNRGCDGVICGHIHTPNDKMISGIHYLNSGDWVESLTAIVEHPGGKLEVLAYSDFRLILRKALITERFPAMRVAAESDAPVSITHGAVSTHTSIGHATPELTLRQVRGKWRMLNEDRINRRSCSEIG